MTDYGVKVKNRNQDILIGQRNLQIKKISSGTVRPEYKSAASGTTYNSHTISYSGVSRKNALVFAKPVAANITSGFENPFDRLLKGYWMMGVRFNSSNFTIIAPDMTQSYQLTNSTHDSREFNTSMEWWGTSENTAKGKVYWELWTVGSADTEDNDEGIIAKTAANEVLFSSNREVFRAEKLQYSQPKASFYQSGSILSIGRNSDINLEMNNRSNLAQLNYMALLNGTAHTTSFIKGGDATNGGYLAPEDEAAFFQSFCAWIYQEENNLYSLKPTVKWLSALAYNKNTSNLTSYGSVIRRALGIGVKTLAMIGVMK